MSWDVGISVGNGTVQQDSFLACGGLFCSTVALRHVHYNESAERYLLGTDQ